MSNTTTQDIQIEVETQYILEQSKPEQNHYFFAYHIIITNHGKESVQLISRHWVITDENGQVEEVKGPGVVGEQPLIEPGESYEYTSFCPFKTPSGSMHGSYQMLTSEGETFDAKIPLFHLATENVTYH